MDTLRVRSSRLAAKVRWRPGCRSTPTIVSIGPVLRLLALDQFCRLPGVEIGQAQFALGRSMRLTKVRGNDAEGFPIATEQRRGLYCAKASGGSNRTVRCKVRIGQNVFYDDPLGAL